jgi:hypothetical protein
MKEVFTEHQMCMKLFCSTPLCFELVATNRFKEAALRELMAFIREPQGQLPANIKRTWQRMILRPGDPRLREARFQDGHMIAIYWDTVARWTMMRARRDAESLGEVLYLLQAADESTPCMPRELAAKLMNKVNPADTGGMHGMLPVHIGMCVRLLDHVDLEKGLVKGAEGTVVHVACHPSDEEEVDQARQHKRPAYLRHVPYGIWLRMDKYTGAPFGGRLQRHDEALTSELTQSLVFVEPQRCQAFEFRGHKVNRTGFHLGHGRAVTSSAAQGRTMKQGVIVDCGQKMRCMPGVDAQTREDDYWLHMYVMLSRATRSEDLLLMRAPCPEFLLRGPPKDLKRALKLFNVRTEHCRTVAEELAAELGFSKFLRY